MEEDIKKYSNGLQTPDPNDRLFVSPYILSPIPLKNGKITHYHLAYNLVEAKNTTKTNEVLISWLEEISGTVSGTPRIYVDNTLQVLKEDLRLFEKAPKIEGEVEFPLKAFQ